jgi:hypothetical protein
MISLLVTLMVLLLILAIAWWAISQLPLPDPFRWVAIVLIALIAILVLLHLLPVADVRLPVR